MLWFLLTQKFSSAGCYSGIFNSIWLLPMKWPWFWRQRSWWAFVTTSMPPATILLYSLIRYALTVNEFNAREMHPRNWRCGLMQQKNSNKALNCMLKSMSKKNPLFERSNLEKFFNILLIFSTRVYQMVADINSGIIFSLLPINVVGLGLTMYIVEHVKKQKHIQIPFFSILRRFNRCIFSVWFRSNYFYDKYCGHNFVIDLALVFLLFCQFNHRSRLEAWHNCL